jgi:hypothetical protein
VIAASRIARADDRRVDFGLIASAAYATIAAVTADMRLVRNVPGPSLLCGINL